MNQHKITRIIILSVAVAAIGLTGCSSKVARNVDVSSGDYYSAEEFKNLSREQRDAYCAELQAELAQLESAKAGTEKEQADLQRQISSIESEIKQLQSKVDRAKGEVDGIKEQIDYFEGLPKVHVVEDGEFLQKISGYERIYADPTKWPRIYRANKDKIEDPNLIFPGWELVIPRDWPMHWTVKQDEYLSKIASYWEVYGDGTAWPKIYEANKDKISDPDMIWPDWDLTIPRD